MQVKEESESGEQIQLESHEMQNCARHFPAQLSGTLI